MSGLTVPSTQGDNYFDKGCVYGKQNWLTFKNNTKESAVNGNRQIRTHGLVQFIGNLFIYFG